MAHMPAIPLQEREAAAVQVRAAFFFAEMLIYVWWAIRLLG